MKKLILYIFISVFASHAYSYDEISKFIGNPVYEQTTELCSKASKEHIVVDKNKTKQLRKFEKNELLGFLLYKGVTNERECYVSQLKEASSNRKLSREDWEFIDYMNNMNQVFRRVNLDFEVFYQMDKILQVQQPFRWHDLYDQIKEQEE